MADITKVTHEALVDVFLSVVVVIRNGGMRLRGRLDDLSTLLTRVVTDHELIVVDNGSTDDTCAVLEQAASAGGVPNLQCYILTKEVDYDTACWAGVVSALGDYVAVVDLGAAGQRVLPEMLSQAAGGAEVVLVRNTREPRFSSMYRLCKTCFVAVSRWLAGIDLASDAPRTRLLSRRVVTYLQQFQVPTMMYRSLAASAGFRKAALALEIPDEVNGDSSLLRAAQRGLQFLITSSSRPMRLANFLALFGAVANIVYSLYVITVAFTRQDVAPGWVTLSLQQSGMFFLISLVLFILGEYVLNLPALLERSPRWHVAREFMSATITRRNRLNVEENVQSAGQPAGDAETRVPHA